MQKFLPIVFGSASLCITLPSEAAERILVQVPAVLAPEAPIPDPIKKECAVPFLLGNHVFQAVSQLDGGAEQVDSIDKAGQLKVLQLTILSVHGFGGGSWSGAKSITIKANLVQSGTSVQSIVLQRSSKGGVFAPVSGTCSIMERIATALGRDVAAWLRKTSSASQVSGATVSDPSANASEEKASAPQSETSVK